MDKRIKKTKASLKAAFMELRSEKELDRISVKELCDKAGINKSTFYTHYTDIYDFAGQLAYETIGRIVANIPKEYEYQVNSPEAFVKALYYALENEREILDVMYSGKAQRYFAGMLEKELKKMFFAKYPEMAGNDSVNYILTFFIHGAYNAQLRNPQIPMEKMIDLTMESAHRLTPLCTKNK